MDKYRFKYHVLKKLIDKLPELYGGDEKKDIQNLLDNLIKITIPVARSSDNLVFTYILQNLEAAAIWAQIGEGDMQNLDDERQILEWMLKIKFNISLYESLENRMYEIREKKVEETISTKEELLSIGDTTKMIAYLNDDKRETGQELIKKLDKIQRSIESLYSGEEETQKLITSLDTKEITKAITRLQGTTKPNLKELIKKLQDRLHTIQEEEDTKLDA